MDLPPRCYRCGVCDLIFKDPQSYLSETEEKERYDLHENHDTVAYRAFLAKTFDPLRPHLTPNSRGLDFGCGPRPVMERMLAEEGYSVRSYDPYFFPEAEALRQTYDFILCSEVAEHFYHPKQEFERIDGLLKKGGWLAVGTAAPPIDPEGNGFKRWHYHRDPTHVVFFGESTMRWLAPTRGWRLVSHESGVSVFQKMPK